MSDGIHLSHDGTLPLVGILKTYLNNQFDMVPYSEYNRINETDERQHPILTRPLPHTLYAVNLLNIVMFCPDIFILLTLSWINNNKLFHRHCVSSGG